MNSFSESWVLRGVSGSVKDREFLLLGHDIRIGRTNENDIVIPEQGVSRHHASITVQHNGCFIRDKNSKNGTYVNEKRVIECELSKNDRLRIGACCFVFTTDSEKKSVVKPESQSMLPISFHAQAFSKVYQHIQKNSKRIAIYGIIALIAAWMTKDYLTSPSSQKKLSSLQQTVTPTPLMTPEPETIKATDDEIETWKLQANAALQFGDTAAAWALYKKIVAARPLDKQAKTELSRSESRLKSTIVGYDENAAREFEKLNYDKAIREWRKVLALSKTFDPEMYEKTEERIREALEKIRHIQ